MEVSSSLLAPTKLGMGLSERLSLMSESTIFSRFVDFQRRRATPLSKGKGWEPKSLTLFFALIVPPMDHWTLLGLRLRKP